MGDEIFLTPEGKKQLEEKLKKTYHFDIPVIVRTKEELLAAVQLPIVEKENVYFI